MSEVQKLQTEPFGSKRMMKKQVDRELRATLSADADVLITEYAKKLAETPPIFRREPPFPPEGLGWFYPIGNVGAKIYAQLLRTAQSEIGRLIQQYGLDRGDAAWWRQWLTKRAAFWAAQHARTAGLYVADRMAGIFSRRYGVPFAHHCGAGAAVFFIPDDRLPGEEWRVVRDTIRGGRPGDPDYLRIVYIYNPDRLLMLRLHYTNIPLPWGRVVQRWIISQVWEGLWDIGARIVAWQ